MTDKTIPDQEAKSTFLKWMDTNWQNEQILKDRYNIDDMYMCWKASVSILGDDQLKRLGYTKIKEDDGSSNG
jgi:hypothetical protein